MLNLKPGTDVVETIYTSAPRYGSHKLICVGKNITKIRLSSHPDNEEFIIINPCKRKFKPLFLIIGLEKHEALEKKAKSGRLTVKDIIALKLKYNDPETSFFIMMKSTPHWEATVPGKGPAPVFFVTEPAQLKMNYLNTGSYRLLLNK